MTTDASSDLSYADTLWKSADALRGQVDAAEYKHVVLGLLFLKYISDSFQSRRDELQAELTKAGMKPPQIQRLLESRDEYTAERIFWVPPESRWPNLQNQATRPDIATLIDDAILAVERDNPNLKSKLPRDYARRGIEPIKLKGLIDLIAGIGFKGTRDKARDTLGRVYEYFLGKFAAAEGKLGGEFYTPRSVVRVLVEMLEPYAGRVYDPCCGSGGMFVQSEKFVEAHGGNKTDISVFGQESNPTTWRLAHYLHGGHKANMIYGMTQRSSLRATARLVTLVLLSLVVTGCRGGGVKNTEGVRLATDRMAKAELLAYDLKRSLPPESADAKEVRRLYTDAAGEVKGYLAGITTDARIRNTVDEPAERFISHPASAAVERFLTRADELRGSNVAAFDPVSAAAIAHFVASLIERLDEYHGKKLKAEIDRFVSVVTAAYPLAWDDIEASRLVTKYEARP